MNEYKSAVELGMCWLFNNLDQDAVFGLDYKHLKREMFEDLGLDEEVESITCDGNCKGCQK